MVYIPQGTYLILERGRRLVFPSMGLMAHIDEEVRSRAHYCYD